VVTPVANVRTFDLFSQVLHCASRGQLTPATIDVTLREFAIARGSAYTNSLTRVAEEFVNGLAGVMGAPVITEGPSGDVFARITRLYFELLTCFTELQTTQIDDCLRALLDAADAPLGGTAASSLIVENSGSEPLLVSCLTTAVRRADGVGPAFVPAIALTPLEDTVRPGEELRVTTALSLDPGVYEPDVLYIGALRLMRQQSLHLEVPLHITATRSAP
jgi:hypothetical protein